MGISIDEATHQKIERNRREGRLCQGACRSRVGCTVRATWRITSRGWTYTVGEGTDHVNDMVMCGRHAREWTPGSGGVNFIVLAKTRI